MIRQEDIDNGKRQTAAVDRLLSPRPPSLPSVSHQEAASIISCSLQCKQSRELWRSRNPSSSSSSHALPNSHVRSPHQECPSHKEINNIKTVIVKSENSQQMSQKVPVEGHCLHSTFSLHEIASDWRQDGRDTPLFRNRRVLGRPAVAASNSTVRVEWLWWGCPPVCLLQDSIKPADILTPFLNW